MCFAIPGKVVEVDGDKVTVDYEIEKKEVGCVFDVSVGDWVIVSNKIIIKKVPEDEALEAIRFIKGNGESVERYFFKYAFPCANVILERGNISQEEFDNLKRLFDDGEVPEREILEGVFSKAFERIDRVASRMGKVRWDLDVVKEYWKNEHNRLINNNEEDYEKAPESFKDLCRINIAEVVERKEDMLIVKYGSGNVRVVFNSLVPSAKVGDRIKIHYGYGVEIVDKIAKSAKVLRV